MLRRAAFLLVAALGFPAPALALITPILAEQHAPRGVFFPQPIEVRVTNESGTPVADTVVGWRLGYDSPLTMESFLPACSPDAGGTCSVRTDSAGIARLGRMMGTRVGVHALRVYSNTLGETTIRLVVDEATAPELSIISGAGQRAVVGTPHAEPFVVRLLRDGTPVRDAVVYFVSRSYPAEGQIIGTFPGEIGSATVVTDADGYARAPIFTAGWGLGTGTLHAIPAATYPAGAVSISFTNTTSSGATSADFTDMWWGGADQAGWGLSVTQHENRIFTLLFSYDNEGNPTWRVMSTGRWRYGLGSQFDGHIHDARGSPFQAYDAARFSLDLVGSMTLAFRGEDSLRIWGGINVPWLQPGFGSFGQLPLHRWDFSGQSTEPLRGVADLWWGGGAQPGWGVSIFERPGSIFAMWFTYDDAGRPTWYVFPEGKWVSQNVFEGRIFSAKGAGWFIKNYDVSRFRTTDVGPFRLRFLGPNQAELDYDVNGRTGTLKLERFDF